MDVALKKVELIEWLVKLKDEAILSRVEALKKVNLEQIYLSRIPKTPGDLQEKLDHSNQDITVGRVLTQSEVENFFEDKFKK
jgi:hypothetical protein